MFMNAPTEQPCAKDDRGWHRRPGRFAHVFGALDLGTNNCRLLIARPVDHGFRVIDAFSRIVRLGEGVAASGRLTEAAMGRALDALKVCAHKLERRRVTRWRCVATEACRRASNGSEFLTRVAAETGIDLEVIGGDEEARLALGGCSPLLDYDHRHALIFDIGGGSTELIWVALDRNRETRQLGWVSLPCGVVNLAERFPSGDDSGANYEPMVQAVRAMLEPFDRDHDIAAQVRGEAVQLLGTSGTVTTIAGVLLDLPRYERSAVDGRWIDFDDVIDVSRDLAGKTIAERARHPCIGPDRADLVVAGCAILEAIHRVWPAQRLRVADRGVREGILTYLMRHADGDRFPIRDHRGRGFQSLNGAPA